MLYHRTTRVVLSITNDSWSAYLQMEKSYWYWTDQMWLHLNNIATAKHNHNGKSTIHISYTKSLSIAKKELQNVWAATCPNTNFITFFAVTVNSDCYLLLVQQFLTTFIDEELEDASKDNTTAHTLRKTLSIFESVLARIISQLLWPSKVANFFPLCYREILSPLLTGRILSSAIAENRSALRKKRIFQGTLRWVLHIIILRHASASLNIWMACVFNICSDSRQFLMDCWLTETLYVV